MMSKVSLNIVNFLAFVGKCANILKRVFLCTLSNIRHLDAITYTFLHVLCGHCLLNQCQTFDRECNYYNTFNTDTILEHIIIFGVKVFFKQCYGNTA